MAFKARLLSFGKCLLLLICFLTVGKSSKNEEFRSSFGFLKNNSQSSNEIAGVVCLSLRRSVTEGRVTLNHNPVVLPSLSSVVGVFEASISAR